MDDNEPLGPGTEHHIASCIADGTASPEDARRLLAEFVRQADAKGKVSARLIEHFTDCLRAFLAGKKDLLPAPQEGRVHDNTSCSARVQSIRQNNHLGTCPV